MAENKKGFILYADLLHTIKKLPLEKAGALFLHILKYVNDENPIADDLLLEIAFEPIKQSLKRDLNKWAEGSEARIEKARKAGLASAKARELKATKSNLVVENQLGSTKSTVSVSVTDSVSVNKDNIYPSFSDFWDLYDIKIDRKKSEAKWNTLSYKTKSEVIAYIPAYKLNQPDKQYRKHPMTFFNNQSWKNELIKTSTNGTERFY